MQQITATVPVSARCPMCGFLVKNTVTVSGTPGQAVIVLSQFVSCPMCVAPVRFRVQHRFPKK